MKAYTIPTKKKLIAGAAVALVTVGFIGGLKVVDQPDAPQPISVEKSNVVAPNDIENEQEHTEETSTPNTTKATKKATPEYTANKIENNVVVPESTPVVVSYKQIPLDDKGNIDCEYTYSDSTTHRFTWQTISQVWVEDGQGQNGRYVDSIHNSGVCDDSALGRPKEN
jgi:hypothetical protein